MREVCVCVCVCVDEELWDGIVVELSGVLRID